MNQQQRAAVQRALAKVRAAQQCHPNAVMTLLCEADELMEQLLEQPVQEPVAFKVIKDELCYKSQEDDQSFGMWCPVTPQTDLPFVNGTEFYTTPPAQPAAWVGLTDEKILAESEHWSPSAVFIEGAKWADAKLREKNGGKV